MVLLDSRSYYGIYVKIHWINIIIFTALSGSQPLFFFGAVGLVAAWHQTKARYYVGINILVTSMAYTLFILFISGMHVFFTYVGIVGAVNILIFYYLVVKEANILKRPIFDLNDEEAARARKAYKTRSPVDIENISKIKPWGDSLRPD